MFKVCVPFEIIMWLVIENGPSITKQTLAKGKLKEKQWVFV